MHGTTIGGIKGDTRSLDYNPCNPPYNHSFHSIFHVFSIRFSTVKGDTRSLDYSVIEQGLGSQ